jgi:hypothetical protein
MADNQLDKLIFCIIITVSKQNPILGRFFMTGSSLVNPVQVVSTYFKQVARTLEHMSSNPALKKTTRKKAAVRHLKLKHFENGTEIIFVPSEVWNQARRLANVTPLEI